MRWTLVVGVAVLVAAGVAHADELTIKGIRYGNVEIMGVEGDNIRFRYSGQEFVKPLDDVHRVELTGHPDLNRAESLAAEGSTDPAIAAYRQAIARLDAGLPKQLAERRLATLLRDARKGRDPNAATRPADAPDDEAKPATPLEQALTAYETACACETPEAMAKAIPIAAETIRQLVAQLKDKESPAEKLDCLQMRMLLVELDTLGPVRPAVARLRAGKGFPADRDTVASAAVAAIGHYRVIAEAIRAFHAHAEICTDLAYLAEIDPWQWEELSRLCAMRTKEAEALMRRDPPTDPPVQEGTDEAPTASSGRIAPAVRLAGPTDGQVAFFGAGAPVPDANNPASFVTIRHVVYVIDRSGSMHDSFGVVARELVRSIARLRPGQSFHVIFYNRGRPLENPPKKLIPATIENRRKFARFLEEIIPQFTTDPIPAVDRAFDLLEKVKDPAGCKLICLLSDGAFPNNKAVRDPFRSRNANRDVIVNTYLFHYRSKAAVEVMEAIADDNGGLYTFIPPPPVKPQ